VIEKRSKQGEITKKSSERPSGARCKKKKNLQMNRATSTGKNKPTEDQKRSGERWGIFCEVQEGPLGYAKGKRPGGKKGRREQERQTRLALTGQWKKDHSGKDGLRST